MGGLQLLLGGGVTALCTRLLTTYICYFPTVHQCLIFLTLAIIFLPSLLGEDARSGHYLPEPVRRA